MTLSDQDSLSIFTATCPYFGARARASRARMRSLSIHPKIVETKVQNPETHPLSHAKNDKHGKVSGWVETGYVVGWSSSLFRLPSFPGQWPGVSFKEEIARGFFSPVSFWYHPDYPSLLPTSVPLGLLGAHTLKE